jgi:hypothetical protein
LAPPISSPVVFAVALRFAFAAFSSVVVLAWTVSPIAAEAGPPWVAWPLIVPDVVSRGPLRTALLPVLPAVAGWDGFVVVAVPAAVVGVVVTVTVLPEVLLGGAAVSAIAVDPLVVVVVVVVVLLAAGIVRAVTVLPLVPVVAATAGAASARAIAAASAGDMRLRMATSVPMDPLKVRSGPLQTVARGRRPLGTPCRA